jgi:hypothetical protein
MQEHGGVEQSGRSEQGGRGDDIKEMGKEAKNADPRIRQSLFGKVGSILRVYTEFMKNPFSFIKNYFTKRMEARENFRLAREMPDGLSDEEALEWMAKMNFKKKDTIPPQLKRSRKQQSKGMLGPSPTPVPA